MKFSVYNLGCKVNAYECESTAHALEEKGFTRVDFMEDCDVAIIFTCAVTNMAAQKSRKALHKIKRAFPNTAVCMVGCYSQLDDGKIEEADIIVGTAHKKDIPNYIDRFFETKEKIRVINHIENLDFEELTTTQFGNKSRAFLKIQDGCNQFCSYCVIPYARGRERSMKEDAVIANTKVLADNYSEIVLTGIHTGRFGEQESNLAKVISRMLKETNIKRIRISSIEVTEINEALISLMEKEERVAKHLHIPIQSGSNSVLKRMHRPYTTEEFYTKIMEIRKRIPDISISTDLIVGFPGESEEEFIETYDFLKKIQFSFIHVFPFSIREGTLAAKMNGQVDTKIKKDRVRAVTNLSKDLFQTYQEGFIGKKEVMIAEENDGEYTKGYTSNYIPVKIEGHYPQKEIIPIRFFDSKDGIMYVKRLNDEVK